MDGFRGLIRIRNVLRTCEVRQQEGLSHKMRPTSRNVSPMVLLHHEDQVRHAPDAVVELSGRMATARDPKTFRGSCTVDIYVVPNQRVKTR